MIKSDDFKILTTKEEEQVEDLCSYYAELRKYLAKFKLQSLLQIVFFFRQLCHNINSLLLIK